MIYVISDLHLGDKGPRDNFILRGEGRLWNFLDFVDRNNGELIIAGDLFEFVQCNLSAVVVAYKTLLDRLFAKWIPGNHDNALNKFIELDMKLPHFDRVGTMPFEQVINGKTFAFCHGCEGDEFFNTSINPGVGEITAILSGLLEDKNSGPVKSGRTIEDSFISSLEAPLDLWKHLTLQSGRREQMLDAVEQYRKDRGADVVVYGHTHEAGRIGDYHYNCGTWARDKDTYVRIDEDGAVTTWEWKEDHPEPFDKELR